MTRKKSQIQKKGIKNSYQFKKHIIKTLHCKVCRVPLLADQSAPYTCRNCGPSKNHCWRHCYHYCQSI